MKERRIDRICGASAEAEELGEGMDDLTRALTPRGEKQAAKVAVWLDRQLPEGLRVIASPARRNGTNRGRTRLINSKYVQNCCPVAPRKTCSIHQWPNARPRFSSWAISLLGQVIAQLLACKHNACERAVVAAPAAAPGAEPDRADDSAVARVSECKGSWKDLKGR